MLEVIKSQKVKENEIKEIKKKSISISPKIIRKVLVAGVGSELIILGNYAYNLYKSGVGVSLRLPYCSNMVIPYWFMILVGVAPVSGIVFKYIKEFKGKFASDNSSDLASLIGKYHD